MDLTFRPTSTQDPKLMEMLWAYYDSFGIDRITFKDPAQWVGAFDGDDLRAAIGFTRSPDSSIVFVAELVCARTLAGGRALKSLVSNFELYCYRHPDIQFVFANCLEANKPMREFLSRSTVMRPVSTTFACARADLYKENESGRWGRL